MIIVWLYTILTHAFILIGIVAIAFFVYMLITEGLNSLEKVIRTAAAMTGFLTYFGSKAIGLSIPTLMMNSVSVTNPFIFGFFAVIAPSLSGVIVAWYAMRCIKSSEDIASRILIMIVVLILVMFSDVYAATYQINVEREQAMKYLVPNLTFTIAMCLYVIFKYKHKSRPATIT
jgi:hypothetical protein